MNNKHLLHTRSLYPMLRFAALIVVMTVWVMPAKAQKNTDYSGVYYIANSTGYNSNNSTDNYYLVPAEDPQQSHYADAYFHNQFRDKNGKGDYTGTNYGDPEKPFLTTYKTNKDKTVIPPTTRRKDNSVWIVKYASTDSETDYYYIIHATTGKYMVYEYPYKDAKHRKAMHLLTTEAPDENAKFKIIENGDYYNFSPKAPVENSNIYFNPAGNNHPQYYATGGDYWHQGMVGLYSSASDNNSKWILEDTLCQAPVIHYDSNDGNYYITWHDSTANHLPSGYEIRYTTNGDDPTTGSSKYTGDTIIVEVDNTRVRAIVTCCNLTGQTPMVITAEADQVVNSATPNAPTFEVTCDSKLQINCNVTTAAIYYTYTTDGTDPANPDNSSTPYTVPVSMQDNVKVKAIAYNGSIVSIVSDVYRFMNNTPSPSISLEETSATITFGSGETIHYTTDGSDPNPNDAGQSTSPFIISGLNYNIDVHIRVISTSAEHGNSCPEMVVKRPKQPTITTSNECVGPSKVHWLTLTNTNPNNTYWYALSNGSGQPAPDQNTFTEYTLGSTVDIANIPAWDGTSAYVTLHAYAKDAEGNVSNVVSQDYLIKYTEAPMVSHSGTTVTITGSGTIKYRLDGGEELTYTMPFQVTGNQSHTITATAQVIGEGLSCETTYVIVLSTTITTLEQLQSMDANGAYKLGNNIDNAGSYTTINKFTGFFDGAGFTISGLTQPLFDTASGAVIHDVNLKGVSITGTDTVGAIACKAMGYTRIYNCGILPNSNNFPAGTHNTVTATNCAGSIVGSLRDHSRVVNCFSYADVNSNNLAAGIVGRNTYASTAAVSGGKYTKLRTMVVNCMFYGSITSTSDNCYPVYGGQILLNNDNNAINNYNFYSDSCKFNGASIPKAYNCSWPAKHEYLTRYEFIRYLLNSNRELCGWWVNAPYAPATMTCANVQNVPKDASLMAKWVLDTSIAPYPILKSFGKYPSPVNIDADSSWRVTANKWEGKKLGALSVTINPGGHAASGITSTTKNIVITDMDTVCGDYCYRKIQLPYYNAVFGNPEGATWDAKYGGNYKDYAVTGWEITSTNGADGTFTEDWQDGYNFADRYCSNKDKFSESGRIFAQGGYYYVPYDVTSITITAHWGNAIYLANGDNYYDRVNFSHDSNKAGTAFAPAGIRPALGNEKTVYTGKIATVAGNLPDGGSVYDNVIVLVGNHQYCTGGENIDPSNKSFTIMSADFNLDNEPDYCLEWQLGVGTTRQQICPIRFDFLPVVEIGLGLKKHSSTQYYSLGCYQPLGHFEVTETALIRFGQFEFGSRRTEECPIILNGGIFEQYTKGTTGGANAQYDKINYIIIGGNVMMPSFTPGAHVNSSYSYSTRHCAVNVIGGKFDNLYLTGNYNENITPNADNPHCYIDGGWFGQIAAAGTEGIGNPAVSDPKGNVTFKINHARIKEFYGGSTLADKRITGNIDVTIDSSRVMKYCGGPKFGDMYLYEEHPENNKTVTTRATGTIFTYYYGGGNGGTSYVQYDKTDGERKVSSYNWYGNGNENGHLNANYYVAGGYREEDNNYMADYDMTITNVSTGTNAGNAVFRTFFHAAQFSATKTGSIENMLTGCKVLKNFYGAGNLGGVEGNVTTTLIDTEIDSLAFGAGFSASVPEVTIYNLGGTPPTGKTPPTIDVNTGIITPQSGGTSTTYTWCYKNTETNVVVPTGVVIPEGVDTGNPSFEYDGKKYFYTTVSLENLGTVTGNVVLILKGTSKVGIDGHSQTGSVFGGGDQSAVSGNASVILKEGTTVRGNVYGGGNEGPVGGDSEVIIQDD